MDKGGCNQDTGTEVLTEEENLGGNLHPLDLRSNNGETTATD
jgi:hypothetical protein